VTVCIAAIAENNKVIVVLADRMISAMRSGQTVQKAESGVRKIRELIDGWAALISGPSDFGEKVAFDTQRKYIGARKPSSPPQPTNTLMSLALALSGPHRPLPPPVMAECAKSAYQAARRTLVIDEILRPQLLTV
jgi:hypothetical protein